ncbi:MAG: hypothetical protein GX752_08020 [Clostridium sp.]|nr:hypothetical protein [Clostridium sp.]
MKCVKLILVSAVSMAAGALIYKAVRDNQEELDMFIDEYGDFISDDLIEPEYLEEDEEFI